LRRRAKIEQIPFVNPFGAIHFSWVIADGGEEKREDALSMAVSLDFIFPEVERKRLSSSSPLLLSEKIISSPARDEARAFFAAHESSLEM